MSGAMRKISISLSAVFLVLGILGPVQADLIDFESGFIDKQPITQVSTPTNTVTFGVGLNQKLDDKKYAYIAQVGTPKTAFVPYDTPADLTVSGRFFLTDEKNGPWFKLDYYMSFETPVWNLALNLYDYRVLDGGPRFGDTATLWVFGQDGAVVGKDIYTIPWWPIPPNGNIINFSVMDAIVPIKTVWLEFSRGDVGTGIDNIRFTTVPLPPSLPLLGSGLLGLVGWRRFRKV
jgi:hypothetical protein